MSKRVGVFCDIEENYTNREPVTCNGPAIGKCVVCEKDICQHHALHPLGGFRITVELIGTSHQGMQPTGVPNLADAPVGHAVTERLHLCRSCAGLSALSNDQTPRSSEIKKIAMAAALETAPSSIRAGLTAEALKK